MNVKSSNQLILYNFKIRSYCKGNDFKEISNFVQNKNNENETQIKISDSKKNHNIKNNND